MGENTYWGKSEVTQVETVEADKRRRRGRSQQISSTSNFDGTHRDDLGVRHTHSPCHCLKPRPRLSTLVQDTSVSAQRKVHVESNGIGALQTFEMMLMIAKTTKIGVLGHAVPFPIQTVPIATRPDSRMVATPL